MSIHVPAITADPASTAGRRHPSQWPHEIRRTNVTVTHLRVACSRHFEQNRLSTSANSRWVWGVWERFAGASQAVCIEREQSGRRQEDIRLTWKNKYNGCWAAIHTRRVIIPSQSRVTPSVWRNTHTDPVRTCKLNINAQARIKPTTSKT